MKMIKTVNGNKRVKKAPEGYSWTTFFFGAFVPLLRGMPFGTVAKLWIAAIFTLGLSNIYFGFKINDEYIEWLEDEGYQPVV